MFWKCWRRWATRCCSKYINIFINGSQQPFNPTEPESARYRYTIQQQRAEISFSARGNRFSILRAQLPSPERFTISPSILEPKTQLPWSFQFYLVRTGTQGYPIERNERISTVFWMRWIHDALPTDSTRCYSEFWIYSSDDQPFIGPSSMSFESRKIGNEQQRWNKVWIAPPGARKIGVFGTWSGGKMVRVRTEPPPRVGGSQLDIRYLSKLSRFLRYLSPMILHTTQSLQTQLLREALFTFGRLHPELRILSVPFRSARIFENNVLRIWSCPQRRG